MANVIRKVPKMGKSTEGSRFNAATVFLGREDRDLTMSVHSTGEVLAATDGAAAVIIEDDRISLSSSDNDLGIKIAEKIPKGTVGVCDLTVDELFQLCYPCYAIVSPNSIMGLIINVDRTLGTVMDLPVGKWALKVNAGERWIRLMNIDPKYILWAVKSACMIGVHSLSVSFVKPSGVDDPELPLLILTGPKIVFLIRPQLELHMNKRTLAVVNYLDSIEVVEEG